MAQEKTLGEKLGHKRDARLLILHGDDLGMCRAANQAAEELFTKGWMNSGSAMVPCPWFPGLAAWAKRQKTHDLGLHLTLNCEWSRYRWGPVLGAGSAPSLCDADGFMHKSTGAVADKAKLPEVAAELRAQVARARRLGLEPTHIDSHMGAMFASPGLFATYLKLAKDEKVVPMIPRPNEKQLKMLARRGMDKMAGLMLKTTAAMGFPIIDSILDPEGRDLPARKAWLLKALKSLEPGVHQLIVHPSVGGRELRHITGSHRERDADYKMMLDPEIKAAIEAAGITLVTWREISAVWKAAKK